MTLTEASYWTRRFGLLGAVVFVLLICGVTVALILDRPSEGLDAFLTPDYACTQYAEEFRQEVLVIPSLKLATDSEYIDVDTFTGKTDSLPEVANVYEYIHEAPSLIAEEKAKDIGQKLGFDPEKIKRRGTIQYYWDEDAYGRFLTVEANTLNFNLGLNYKNNAALPADKNLPSNEEAKQIATSFLRSKGWLLSEFEKEDPIVTLINIDPDGTFSMARSREEAELIRVDFYRSKPFLSLPSTFEESDNIKADIEKKYYDYESVTESIDADEGRIDMYYFTTEIVHTDTQKSNISVYVGPDYKRKSDSSITPNIYDVDFISWVIQVDQCGKYKLINDDQIPARVANGEASLMYINDVNGDTVVPYRPREARDLAIKQVKLAYLDTPERQKYLQPVYIIIGDATMENGEPGRFYYYMPAIDYENIQDRTVDPNAPTTTEEDNSFL